ncbi:MAG: NAD(P)H-dependent oxidoreductase [Lachnospiraceae bacterium]|nr:NAD(P)H-dependent oxidoreductase [Lachnospiraceae bacterium]MBR3397361.1 NAD(P)H-dependent oxidoreductase [Lachnospiraceae bacterium]
MKTLVAYFSAEGTTAKVAKALAEKIGADLFEIVPDPPYSAADIRWTNPLARCNREKLTNKKIRIKEKVDHFEEYDLVLLGFPIWYGAAPNVVNCFCREYDWSGKKVYAFATSGGSKIGRTAEKLKPYINGGLVVGAKLVQSAVEMFEIAENLQA